MDIQHTYYTIYEAWGASGVSFTSAFFHSHSSINVGGTVAVLHVGDVYYLSKNIGAVPMEGVEFSIKGVDMSSSLHRADSWTILLCTQPLTTVTHTEHTHTCSTHTKYMSTFKFETATLDKNDIM